MLVVGAAAPDSATVARPPTRVDASLLAADAEVALADKSQLREVLGLMER